MRPERRDKKELPWVMPEDAWRHIRVLLDSGDPPRITGRPRSDRRRIIEGIVYRFLRGSRWRKLPKEYGDDSTIHRTFHRWDRLGLFERVWKVLLESSPELDGIVWKWEPPPAVIRRTGLG